jgi:hypothetical protein
VATTCVSPGRSGSSAKVRDHRGPGLAAVLSRPQSPFSWTPIARRSLSRPSSTAEGPTRHCCPEELREIR